MRKLFYAPSLTGLVLALAAPAFANTVGATATLTCTSLTITLSAGDLSNLSPPATGYAFVYTVTAGANTIGPVTVPFSTGGAGSFSETLTVPVTLTGTVATISGTVTLLFNGSPALDAGTPAIVFMGETLPLTCGGGPPPPPTLTLTCAASSGQVGTPYSSALVATGGVAPYTFSITSGMLPPPLMLNATSGAITGTPTTSGTFSFTAQVVDSSGIPATNTVTSSCSITVASGPPPPTCSTGLAPITYNLSESSKNASEIVWFNSHFKLQGTLPTTDFTVLVTNGTIQFGTSTLTVPNALITFSSSATCASTTFNTVANQWQTTLPLASAGHADEIFAAGLAYVLPPSFPQNVQGVTWTANFTASVPSLQIQWQWGAANYLSTDNKGHVFPMTGGGPDYNAMMVDPGHNVTTCAGYNGGDHAGTPENATVKALVTGGGSGGGGSNWTGSWSSTGNLMCSGGGGGVGPA